MDKSLKSEFWKRVKKSKTGCWIWLGSKTTKGYGRLKYKSVAYGAHRLSYEINKGNIPKNYCVCHSCDNPPCVNPEHLWLGTHADNQRDCFKKGRRASGLRSGSYTMPHKVLRGEANGRSRLKEKDIRNIRKLVGTMSQEKLAIKFGTPQTNISRIIARKAWAHVSE